MSSRLIEIFEDPAMAARIRNKLPKLFTIAEQESSRAGRIGMEVGSARERILIALLIYAFERDNVETEIPITEPDVDVRVFGSPVSIKTITGIATVKVSWTVDAWSAQQFWQNYAPKSDVLLAQIKWDLSTAQLERGEHPGGLFYIPLEAQDAVLNQIGKEDYLLLPKEGTNPRGVEISRIAIRQLLQHSETRCIEMLWKRSAGDYDPYKRWLDYWTDE